jgi:DNA-binding beta-propeller fold protein YncE
MWMLVSDKKNGRLERFDLDTFKHSGSIDVGAGAYPCDQVGEDLVYVSTRDETFLRPVMVSAGKALEPIDLGHQPRSTSWDHDRGLAFVGARTQALVSVVDITTGKVVHQVGSGSTDERRDYGGSLATGHPGVGPNGEILMLDRIARRIELYEVGRSCVLSSINLPSSPHHVHGHDGVYFALCEGNQDSRIAPSVIRFQVVGGELEVLAHRMLPVFEGDWALTGGHHLTVDVPANRVYVGTAAGWLYTLHATDLDVLNRTEAGRGCGHVTLCREVGLGVTTNHTDTFMTVFSLRTGRRVREVEVSGPANGNAKTQGHTSFWSPSSRRLYTTAAAEGRLLEIDPATGTVTRELQVANADLIQGCVVRRPSLRSLA